METTATNKAKLGKDTVTKWAFRPFENQGRKDGLRLSHWVKAAEPEASYPFSKFNKPSRVPHYTRDEYVVRWRPHTGPPAAARSKLHARGFS